MAASCALLHHQVQIVWPTAKRRVMLQVGGTGGCEYRLVKAGRDVSTVDCDFVHAGTCPSCSC